MCWVNEGRAGNRQSDVGAKGRFLTRFSSGGRKGCAGIPGIRLQGAGGVSSSGDGGQYAAYVRAGSGRTETEEKCDTASGGKMRERFTIFSL